MATFRVHGQWTASGWIQDITLQAATALEASRCAERAGIRVLGVKRVTKTGAPFAARVRPTDSLG
jgi:hypothetical protein